MCSSTAPLRYNYHVSKTKVFAFTTTDNVRYQLTEKEKRFCEVYCQFGVSGIEAVYQAGYSVGKKGTAYSVASENLRKPKILAYINSLYKTYKFTDEEVMREHLFLIKQHASLSNKARAIDMYYKKKGMYKEEKQETPQQRPYKDWTDEQLQARIDELYSKILKERGLRIVPIESQSSFGK